jgi:hypothetical protein
MNFYYDPILGLQYTCLGAIFEIDIATIPEEYTFEDYAKICKRYYEQGFIFGNVNTWMNITDYNLN